MSRPAFVRPQDLPAASLPYLCPAIVAACTVLRYLFVTTIDLRVDEAYYWTWSKEHVISYLDHPPMVAWLIKLGTLAAGDTNLGVRLPGLLSMLIMQCLLAAIVLKIVRNLNHALAVVLMTESTLAYGLGMAKITPDIALIPCELGMFMSLVHLAQSKNDRWWLLAGLFGGLALMAKYTAILFVPAIAAFVVIPPWRGQQLTGKWLWLGLAIALLVFSPVLLWNFDHDWASFRFQLSRPAQVTDWSAKFLLDFVGQQFGLIGVILLPVALAGTAMLALRGYRQRDPVRILLSTAVLFPLGFFGWHGFSARIGDSWPLFIWPIALACGAINLRDIQLQAPTSRVARLGRPTIAAAIVSGLTFVIATQAYYIWGQTNYLKNNDPIGKEAGFSDVVSAAEATRHRIGATWYATTDYRIYSMLRWHLRHDGLPVVQINERRRFIGFAEPILDDSAGLYVGAEGDPDASVFAATSADLRTVGEADLIWRSVKYDTYLFQKLTNWRPILSPPSDDRLAYAHPH